MRRGRYQVEIVGAKQASRNLKTMANNMLSFEQAFEDIGDYFRVQVETQFDLRGALPGVRGPWAPLKPATIRLRHGSSQPLVRYSKLKRSWATKTYPRNVSEVGAKKARFGSGHKARANNKKIVPTAIFHQLGTRKMVARPVVLGNRFLDEEILDAFSDHLFRGWI